MRSFGAILADGATVEDLAMVEFSVLGAEASTASGHGEFSVVSRGSVGGLCNLAYWPSVRRLNEGLSLDLSLSETG